MNDFNSDKFANFSRDQLLMLWDEKKQLVETAKADEMELRKYIVAKAFPDKKEGVNKVELGAGYELKASVKYNYKLSTDINKVSDIADKIAVIGNTGAVLSERIFKWSADLVLAEYRALCDDNASAIEKQIKMLVDEVLTISEGAPTLEIKSPKKTT